MPGFFPLTALIVVLTLLPLSFSLGYISFLLMLLCGATWSMVSAHRKSKQNFAPTQAHPLIPSTRATVGRKEVGNLVQPRTQQLFSTLLIATFLSIGLFGGGTLYGADFSGYRGFQLGTTITTAAAEAGVSPSEAETLYTEPELVQELKWRPELSSQTDPVKNGLLQFLNGKLFRIVSNYDRYKVEGMSAEDMVAAISETYGPATLPEAEVPYKSIFGNLNAPVLGRWQDADYEFNLVQADHTSGYALIITDKKLAAMAEVAIDESIRLEVLDAPRRALEVKKQREKDEQLRLDEIRSVNQDNFRP